MDNANRAYKQVLANMSASDAAYFKNAQSYTYDDYYEKMEKEKKRTMRQLNKYDEVMGERTIVEDFSTNFSTVEDDVNYDVDPGWLDSFDDLNDFDD